MRKIKFRGIYVDTGEWVYGYLVNQGEDKAVIFDPEAGSLGTYYVVKKETVGQCIGKEDKDGKEIYGGDLFHCIYYPEGHEDHIYKVSYSEDSAKFFPKRIGSSCVQVAVVQTMSDMSRYKIIGNVTDNPELLEGNHGR